MEYKTTKITNKFELLEIVERMLNGATQIYMGLDVHCRCGCGGKYHTPNTRLFKWVKRKILGEIKSGNISEAEHTITHDGGTEWMNLPRKQFDNKCYCVYIERSKK